MKLTLTSLNLQGFEDWEQRSPKILNYLSEVDPDVIFFQETVFLPSISPHNQAQLLNQQLRYPFELSTISRLQTGIDYPIYREGLAFLSKYPVTSSDTLTLKKDPTDELNRIIQLIDIAVEKKVIRLGSVHFSITDFIDYATPHLQETLDILKARNENVFLWVISTSPILKKAAICGAMTTKRQQLFLTLPTRLGTKDPSALTTRSYQMNFPMTQ